MHDFFPYLSESLAITPIRSNSNFRLVSSSFVRASICRGLLSALNVHPPPVELRKVLPVASSFGVKQCHQ